MSEQNDYFLQWKTQTAIQPEDLMKAASLVSAITDEAAALQQNQPLEVQHDSEEQITRFFTANQQVAAFGYPPQAFLDSLSSRERTAVMELGTSRDGWLAQNGEGQGIIVTGKQLYDFPVRLYLSILAAQNKLKMSCSDDIEYEGLGLEVSTSHTAFAWYPLWREIKPIVEKHWFVRGQTKVTFTDSEAAESAHAW